MGFTTYQKDMPQVHLHFRSDDELADVQGYAETEICCHACGYSEIILYNLPPKGEEGYGFDGDPKITSVLDRFKRDHAACIPPNLPTIFAIFGRGNDRFVALCPEFRKSDKPEIIDLRYDKPEDRLI